MIEWMTVCITPSTIISSLEWLILLINLIDLIQIYMQTLIILL